MRIGMAALLIAVVALVCFVRIRLASVPLERDEGEYAYAGQLILKGVPPYAEIYNMKFPGMYYAYAGLMAIFGQTPTGIRIGLLVIHLVSLALLYVWGRRVAGELAAGIGTAAFALLALDRWSMGIFAHATHFVVLFVIAGLVMLQGGGSRRRLFAAGVLLGLAIVMKQQAIPFAVLGIALAARRGLLVLAGIGFSLLALVGLMAAQGVLRPFWHWTFEYAAAYVSTTPAALGPSIFSMAWGYITTATAWWWYLGLLGVLCLFVTRWPNATRMTLVGALAAAALSIVPGYFFRPHYFILAMPVIGVLAGVTFMSADRILAGAMRAATARILTVALVAAIAAVQVWNDRHFLFGMSSTELIREVYQTNPFLEAPAIGQYLRNHSDPADRVAVLGSEPEMLFYAGRPSATGYIYMYPLTEQQPYAEAMREELTQDLQRVKPRFVVLVDSAPSWVATLQPDTRLVMWANTFTTTCHERVGIIDLDPNGPSVLRWDADAAGYQPRFKSKVTVFRRIDGPGC